MRRLWVVSYMRFLLLVGLPMRLFLAVRKAIRRLGTGLKVRLGRLAAWLEGLNTNQIALLMAFIAVLAIVPACLGLVPSYYDAFVKGSDEKPHGSPSPTEPIKVRNPSAATSNDIPSNGSPSAAGPSPSVAVTSPPKTLEPSTKLPSSKPQESVKVAGLEVTIDSPFSGTRVLRCSVFSGTVRNLSSDKVLWIIVQIPNAAGGRDKYYIDRPIENIDSRTGKWSHSLSLASTNDTGNGPYWIQVHVADKQFSDGQPRQVDEALVSVDGFTRVGEVWVTRGENNC